MERLPSLLTSTIENACRQFRHISFTVHGENDRARVSIVFTNQDSNKTKRKSNSTVNRDKKRMKEYNTDDANSSISENHKDVICSDRSSEISQIPSEEVSTNTLDIMDIDDNPSMASTTSGNIEVIESPNIELSIDTGNELSLPPTCLKGKHVNNVEKCKQRITVDRIEKNKCTVEGDNLVTKCTISKKNNSDIVSTTSPGAQSCDKVKEHNRKVPESGIIRKIVFKKSRSGMDMLIGKTERGRLVLFHMSGKNFELLLPGEHEYSRYNKVLTEDFEDVRTTPFMNDEVNEGILKMEKVVKMKRL
ncbi:unnamed protein product [Mytilus edulis]|uniref:Uncharacterized protein n=1 Tax=Mytilus edulis TaxID=6550 RepID=A0A8S3PRJ3_MYTED|nr:unnamed protein product [Mytilus edulis]